MSEPCKVPHCQTFAPRSPSPAAHSTFPEDAKSQHSSANKEATNLPWRSGFKRPSGGPPAQELELYMSIVNMIDSRAVLRVDKGFQKGTMSWTRLNSLCRIHVLLAYHCSSRPLMWAHRHWNGVRPGGGTGSCRIEVKHKHPTTHEFWYSPYIGPRNQNLRSFCVCGLLGPFFFSGGVPAWLFGVAFYTDLSVLPAPVAVFTTEPKPTPSPKQRQASGARMGGLCLLTQSLADP